MGHRRPMDSPRLAVSRRGNGVSIRHDLRVPLVAIIRAIRHPKRSPEDFRISLQAHALVEVGRPGRGPFAAACVVLTAAHDLFGESRQMPEISIVSVAFSGSTILSGFVSVADLPDLLSSVSFSTSDSVADPTASSTSDSVTDRTTFSMFDPRPCRNPVPSQSRIPRYNQWSIPSRIPRPC